MHPSAPQFKGTWKDRMSGLEDIRVRGKTVLDVGCNMGIIGYELCKREPAHYHGIEVSEAHADVARSIFLAVSTPHDIHTGNILDTSVRSAVLRPAYDVVLLLAVVHHLEKHGSQRAVVEALRDIVSLCQGVLVHRGPQSVIMDAALAHANFDLAETIDHPHLHPLSVYLRG